MITKQDFLDNGFEVACESKDMDFYIKLDKGEIPVELYKQYDERDCFKSYYEIDGKEYIVKTTTEIGDMDIPSDVRTKAIGKRIMFQKGRLCVHTEWVDGKLRHAYQTNCNTDYGWNSWNPWHGTFNDLMQSYLSYLTVSRNNCTSEYMRKLHILKSNYKRELEGFNEKIGVLEGLVDEE